MVFLLLAAYNDSMSLGQGFNSFLHMPCINGAVDIPEGSLTRTQAVRAGGAGNVSQVVSYSSRFVEKISEVVRSMNISAASSIKSGTIEVSGNSMSVDEAKFAASDLNAVISVKVINQTTTTIKNPKFLPFENMEMDSQKFFQNFGDCYVSGFMEGGDLHGIVSVKVLDASKKSEIESVLKGQMNGSNDASGEFTLGQGSGSSAFSAALSQTETTVTVNWSGGGQIKPDEEDWTLDTLVKAASSFPSRVASCPQRTWAILTRYDHNRSFIEWADKHNIVVPDFHRVQQITSDLLDNFMEYKNNLTRLQAVMANPVAYKLSPYRDPVGLSVDSLVAERQKLKGEMAKIGLMIDELNKDPTKPLTMDIKSPILWACRLPVPVDAPAVDASGSAFAPVDKVALVGGFNFKDDLDEKAKEAAEKQQKEREENQQENPDVSNAVKHAVDNVANNINDAAAELKQNPLAPPPLPDLCTASILESLDDVDETWINTIENKRAYAKFRFDRYSCQTAGGGHFNDAPELTAPLVPITWPQRLEFMMCSWGSMNILRRVQVGYDQLLLTHGSEGAISDSMTVEMGGGERVNRIKLGRANSSVWGVQGVVFVEIYTTAGQICRMGSEEGHEVIDYYPYDGCEGLKGWWGKGGDVIDCIGPIWGL